MDLEQRSINVGKALIMDTVRNANSGHTGGPLSSFDFAYVLFKDFLEFTSLKEDEFFEIADSFRPDHLWEKSGNDYRFANNWKLKKAVYK